MLIFADTQTSGRFSLGFIELPGNRMSFVKYTRPNPMHLYEMNYHTLMQLVPELGSELAEYTPARSSQSLSEHVSELPQVVKFTFDMAGAFLEIRLLEINRYTQHIQVINKFKTNGKLLPALCLNIRAYHDVSLAEVISCSGVTKLLPDYTYPNEKMLLKDEKRQANRLLFEWLSSARAYYRFEPVSL